MTIGYGTGTPSAVNTQVNTLPLLTLDAFARAMRYSPVGAFMGIVYPGACEAIDCNKRNAYASSARAAQRMMDDFLGNAGYSLEDEPETLQARAPYFALHDRAAPITTVTRRVTALVTPPVAGDPDRLATLTAIVTLAAGESLVGVAVSLGATQCDRLGIELTGLPALNGNALVLQTPGYNLVDLGALPDGGAPVDNVPYLEEVYLDLTVQSASVPTAHWAPDACAATPCTETTTTGCLYQTMHSIYEVRDYYGSACLCRGKPEYFSLPVTRPGLWRESLADAMVSLLNTRIPINYCVCDPVANERYRTDTGDTDMYRKAYPYSFSNPFGILMPGAQYAWKQLDMLVSGTKVERF